MHRSLQTASKLQFRYVQLKNYHKNRKIEEAQFGSLSVLLSDHALFSVGNLGITTILILRFDILV